MQFQRAIFICGRIFKKAALPMACTLAIMVLSAVFPAAVEGAAPGMGAVTGKIFTEEGYQLPGAVIQVKGTQKKTISNEYGEFILSNVPTGDQTLIVTYMGLGSVQQKVAILAGQITNKNILMEMKIVEEVTVSGTPLLEGQAKALNQQKNAYNIRSVVSSDLIGSFPDPNSAEATQRLPGISIQRDQGEGRYVLVRGTEARLNSMMLNGERLPSPEGDIRNVALDVIPADLLSAIEVSKALTPDMDADAIGGAVNLVLKNAPAKPKWNARLNLGYNEISEKTMQSGSVTYGQRFADGDVGLIFGASYFNTDRGSDNFEVEYDDGELDDFQVRDYTINRKRYGFSVAMDAKLSDASEFKLTGMYNRFDDQEYRRRTRARLGKERMEKEMKDRFESQTIYSIKGQFKHMFGSGVQLDASLSYSYANEDEPDRRDLTFTQKDVIFAPNVGPDFIDPDNIQANPQNENISKYKFDEMVVENNFTSEKDWVAKFDLEIPLTGSGNISTILRAGAKYKNKDKKRDNEAMVYGHDDDIYLSDYLDSGFDAGKFINGRYDPGMFMTIAASSQILGLPGLESEKDVEGDLADYRAKENTFAGYVMAKIFLGENVTIIPGVRYEHTDVDYQGNQIAFDNEGDFDSISPVTGKNNYGVLLPGFHVVYRLDKDSNLRAAFTRTLARPNYYDLVPYRLRLEEDLEIEMGNADLLPTKSWNFDIMYERYFQPLGVISAGVFYKNLSDYIYFFRSRQDIDGDRYRITQPRNGESATLWGVEVSLQSQLTFLPNPLDGIGFLFNYTYTDSEAEYPEREGAKATLPGQSEHVGNLALIYSKGRFNGRVSFNYHGKYIDAVSGDASEDVYYDNHLQMDISASFKINNNLRLFVEVNNLLNEPLRYYIGDKNRPIVEEYYRTWGSVGVQATF